MENEQARANEAFERWSETYDQSYMQWILFDRVHRAILKAIPGDVRPDAVVDIGCGTGRLLRRAKELWPRARLVGVDLAEGMIAHARAAMPEGEFYVGAAEKLPLPNASADLILSTVSFHHWQDQARGVSEVMRVLRPGGRFYLADALPPKIITRLWRHGNTAYPAQLRAMFARGGLKLLSQSHLWGWFFYLSVGEKPE